MNTASLHNRQRQQRSNVASGALGQGPESAVSAAADPEGQGDEQQQQHLSADQVQEKVQQAVSLIVTADELAPYDPGSFNIALLIWRRIAAIPEQHRSQLLKELSSADIKRLWRISAKRLTATRDEQQAAMAGRPMWADLPSEPGQVVVFDGKASLPIHVAGVSSFQKAFFLSPKDYRMYGRVLLRYGALSDLLYPLYYKLDVKSIVIPATEEVADAALDYVSPEELGLELDDLPDSSWPLPKRHLYPFSGGLTDYIRPVGPGVYVGVGWKAPRPGVDLGKQFLHFMLVRQCGER